MTKILIVEGNTPEILAEKAGRGTGAAAIDYSNSLKFFTPELDTAIVEPYTPGFHSDNAICDYAICDSAMFDDISGVVFTGSNVNWSADHPNARPLRNVMEHVFAANIAVLGSCNGLQLAAVILGGKLAGSPNGLELGIAKNIRLTDEGKTHALHIGRSEIFACPCMHRDEVSILPHGAILTATNDHSMVQGFVYETGAENFWGVQYHPEASLLDFAGVLRSGSGIFGIDDPLADLMEAAHENPMGEAAENLGAHGNDFVKEIRMSELANWLDHIKQPKSADAALLA